MEKNVRTRRLKKLWPYCLLLSAAASACSPLQESNQSTLHNLLEGDGWDVGDSPYALQPGETIAVCDTGVKNGVLEDVITATRTWLAAGGRDRRLQVIAGCSGSRVIELVWAPDHVEYYGQTSPLNGNVHRIDVPDKWAGQFTANHEVGHVFGFAHVFDGVVSIMNSENDGEFMNGGYLSDYDYSEVKAMLQRDEFVDANAAWWSSNVASKNVASRKIDCLGVDKVTRYPHSSVTNYKGNTYTCDNGQWQFSKGIQ